MSFLRTRWFAIALFCACVALASCSPPGTDGIVLTSAAISDTDPALDLGDEQIEVTLPHIPVIALPDLSGVGEYDELLRERLGEIALQPVDGVELITAECSAGDAVLSGDETSDVFDAEQFGRGSFTFEIDEVTGASSYSRQHGDNRIRLDTEADGSGVFIEEASNDRVSIEAFADGSGRYYSEQRGTINSVEASADGSGVYYEQQEDTLTTITLGTDNSGALYSESPTQLLTIDARADGSGDLYLKVADRVITLQVPGDGGWELSDSSFTNDLTVKVAADGSGNYRQRGANGTISLDFDAAGASHWRGTPGPQVIVPAAPSFAVADRFPALGTLGSIQPPCATVLRFDSQVLFAVNEHEVLADAQAVLAEVAPALIEAGRSLEINGHTDANGSDEYNQALSERRAQAVADVLVGLGVDVELTINGFGESQPVAENYNADGSDNDAGQRQNRRVEIVIHG